MTIHGSLFNLIFNNFLINLLFHSLPTCLSPQWLFLIYSRVFYRLKDVFLEIHINVLLFLTLHICQIYVYLFYNEISLYGNCCYNPNVILLKFRGKSIFVIYTVFLSESFCSINQLSFS